MSFAPFAAAAWLFVVGLYGVVSSQNLVRTVLSLTVVQSSTYLVLLGVGYRHGAKAPIVADIPTTSRLVDPVTQVPSRLLNDDRTWMGMPYRRAYSTQRSISTLAPHAAISSISS